MRTEINTYEISKIYGKAHRDVMRSVRSIISDELSGSYFNDCKIINDRGREYDAFSMNADGFLLLSNARSYCSGSAATIKARILSEFGLSCKVVLSSSKRGEDYFYETMKVFMPSLAIKRQYPICNYRVDFFIENIGLFVEYDEQHHSNVRQADSDSSRWDDISKFYESVTGTKPWLLRVRKGSEIRALSFIAAKCNLDANYLLVDIINEGSRVSTA